MWLSGLGWAIEQCFEEAKTELGIDHYEVRKFSGWHIFPLAPENQDGKKSTIYYAVAA
ncbi:hypothetical protein DSCA_30130 [Desulfosarcina alkanivorans]|uniref:Uncharacterized protein n=1 Tax=Desulfosarcina alkanivorans TaxID=571177 RepID=A0A5K7YKM9_9BACT|nr:hypothetical protein DSCA_30130 [Desulfosarcina alkanivorans]